MADSITPVGAPGIAPPVPARRKLHFKPVPRGGFIVLRRGDSTKKLFAHAMPHEHGSLASAQAEAERLAFLKVKEFAVFQEVAAARPVRGSTDIASASGRPGGPQAVARAAIVSSLDGVPPAQAGEIADRLIALILGAGVTFVEPYAAAAVPALARLLASYVQTFAADDEAEATPQEIEARAVLAGLGQPVGGA